MSKKAFRKKRLKFRPKFRHEPKMAAKRGKGKPLPAPAPAASREAPAVNGNGHMHHEDVFPFAETLSDGFCRFDTAWKFVYANEASEVFFGEAAKSLPGRRLWDAFPRLADTQFHRECQRAVAQAKPVKVEEFFSEPRLWFSIRICPSEQGVAVYFRDITERKLLESQVRELIQTTRDQASRELLEARERFNHAAAAVEGILYDWDVHKGVVTRTAGIQKLMGFKLEETASTPEWWNERIHPKDMERIRPEFIARLRHDPGFSFEYRVRNRADRYIYVQDQAVIVRGKDGHIERIFGYITDVTERRKAAEVLEKWKYLFEQTSWGLAMAHPTTDRLEFANLAFVKMHGWEMSELLAKTMADLFAPEERPRLAEHVAKLGRTGRISFESIHLRKDGSKFPVAVDLIVYRGSEEEVLYRALHCEDISERKGSEGLQLQHAREMALRADVSAAFAHGQDSWQKALSLCTEAMVRHLDAVAARIWILNEREKVLELQASSGNPADGSNQRVALGETKIGWIAQERKSHVGQDAGTAPQAESQGEQHGRAFAGFPMMVEDRVIGVLGISSRQPVSEPVSQMLGSLAAFMAEGLERRRAAAALQESQLQLKLALESAQMGWWMWNIANNQITWSDNLEPLHGLKAGTFAGTFDAFIECVHPEDRETVREAVKRAVEEKGGYNKEFRIVWPDGSVHWMNGRGKVYCDAQGNPQRMIGLGMDIGERKKVEMDLAEAREKLRGYADELEERVVERTRKLREVNDELESFSYTVSHDLRGPLRAMRGFAHALLEDYASQLDETGRDFSRRIIHAAEHMDLLIQDLVGYSRVTREEMELEIINLGKLVEDVMEQQRGAIEKANAHVSVLGELPMVQGRYMTLCDAFSNLLENAIKFVAPGTTPKVTVRAETIGDQVRLWVEDNGIGIPAEHQERVFRVFERLHTREVYPGTGIGLAIARKAIERMGGQVGLESEAGKGSRFWFQLPKPKLDA